MKLLIVDDEISALFVFLNEIIHESGLEYKFFQDNEEAILNYVTNNHIDSAFLDIRMPNIDGISLAKKILKIKPKTKIVFITGLTITINDIDKNIKNNEDYMNMENIKAEEQRQEKENTDYNGNRNRYTRNNDTENHKQGEKSEYKSYVKTHNREHQNNSRNFNNS